MLESGNDPFHGGTDGGHLLELQWDTTWSSVTSNANGSSGWARVLRSGGGDVSEGACRRAHQCARNPCIARRAASKYGPMGPPIHVQPVDPAAVSFGPSPPSSAPLRAGQAPTPASLDPQLRMGAVSGIRETDAAASGHTIFDHIMRLAREIRTPRTYVGYSFFVLMGLAKKCQPVMWEGAARINLLRHYATWAVGSAVVECAVEGVVCCMMAVPSGSAEMVPVSEDHPLRECRHFAACGKLENALECSGESIQSFYGRLGVVLSGAVMDGECGLDIACVMLGLSQTLENRNALRREIADYLCERHDVAWMHQLLIVCAELNVEDVEKLPQGRRMFNQHRAGR